MKQKFLLKILGIVLFISAISCATRSSPPAPVVNVSQVPSYADTAATKPVVAATPATAPTKPKLQAINNDDEVQTAPATQSQNKTVVAKDASTDNSMSTTSGWQMPTDGTMGAYSSTSKGVNIPGSAGQAIYAVAAGKVLYSGNGLKGYGNLIIIRHDNTYLSAYAYNKTNLVKEGAQVQQGQKIATMGVNENNQAMLHLEVRKNGKPVDPHTMIGN
jgi:lipoprotein NlpD